MRALVILGLAWLVSAVLVLLIRDWAERKAILDHPNERSSHEVPKPRGGGIAIVLITLAGSALWWTPRFAVVALAALVVAVVSGSTTCGTSRPRCASACSRSPRWPC